MTLSGKPLAQRPWEFGRYLNWIGENEITSFLEIGSRYGDSLYEIAQRMPKGSTIVSVDLVDGLWGREDSGTYLTECIEQLNAEGYKASVIFGDSTTSSVIKMVSNRGPFDMCLLDGDHKIEGVTLDWINYGPMCRYVSFHDVDGQDHFYSKTFDRVDVPFLWKALKRRYKYWQWVDKNHRGMGLAIADTHSPMNVK